MEQKRDFFEDIARELTNECLVMAFGVAYHCWQNSDDTLFDDLETEVYTEEILRRMKPLACTSN